MNDPSNKDSPEPRDPALGFLDRASSDAPSELTLDRYAAGELTGEAKAHVETWLAKSSEARARLDAQRDFPASVEHEVLFARIEAGLDAGPRRVAAREPWWRRLLAPGFLGALAAVAVLLVLRPWSTPEPGPGPDTVFAKGGFGFLLHRKTVDGSEVLVSGTTARAGDRLRFEVDLPADGELVVIDQDPKGALAVAWPLDGSDRSRLVPAGPRDLDGAVELDDALGDEWLHAVACPTPVRLADIAATAPGVLRVPAGCSAIGLQLRKVRP